MKVVILAGGYGTRLSEETSLIPKPMVEIGDNPILWHIMKIYSFYGFNDFIICLGYKGYVIKEYFANYFLHRTNIKIDLKGNSLTYLDSNAEPWTVTLVDTGLNTMTGGRIKRIEKYTESETFMLTYGDGLADINIGSLLQFHLKHRKAATVTAVQPPGRFGSIRLDSDDNVSEFTEKPPGDNFWINGGFFVLEPEIFNYIDGDYTIWEQEPLKQISSDKQLVAFRHKGFWQPMDTLRDKNYLIDIWKKGAAPWKVWDE